MYKDNLFTKIGFQANDDGFDKTSIELGKFTY